MPRCCLYAAAVLCLFLSFVQGLPAQGKNYATLRSGESPEVIVARAANVVPSSRQLAWQQLEFISFVHFGMNTFLDQEWGKGTESPLSFNPTDFDARQWVRVIKGAGMKLLIVTAKHHDGFCLWPSKYTEHSVKNSPWRNGGGDVVREVAEACREAGLKFGIYLSPWDRHERTYGDSAGYNEYFRNQLRELLTNYGEVAEVWFDGASGEGPNGKKQVYDWPSYYRLIRDLQPNAVIAIMGPDVRWVGTESGYGRETEWSVLPGVLQNPDSIAGASQQLPADGAFVPRDLTDDDLGSRAKLAGVTTLVWYPAETDVSIRPGWFYHEDQDVLVKSPSKLVDIYYSSVGRNSVLLLNIPPDKRGRITDYDIKSLAGMKTILDQTFRVDLAAGARVTPESESPVHPAAATVDGNADTYWTTVGNAESAILEFDLQRETTFDRAMLMENIAVGQRVESFRLEENRGGLWKEFARGTTIGYKRLLRFPGITSKRVRLIIERSRTNPTLASFSLFQSPPTVLIDPPDGSFEESLAVRLSSGAKGAVIYYTLDGSCPTLNSSRYSGPIALSHSATITATAATANELSAELSVGRFTRCMKVQSATFENPPSQKYPGNGPATIIDGQRGSLDFHDRRWLGFSGDDAIITLGLGASRHVREISIGFLQQQGSWIFLPKRVSVSVSPDGVNWISVAEIENAVVQSQKLFVKDFSFNPGNIGVRFIRIVGANIGICPSWHPGDGDKAWLFVDEVVVR